MVKNLPANAGAMNSIPGSGRSSGEENGNPLQYSCLGNPMGRGAGWATVHGVAKESDTIEQMTTTTPLSMHSMCMITHPGKAVLNMPHFEAV